MSNSFTPETSVRFGGGNHKDFLEQRGTLTIDTPAGAVRGSLRAETFGMQKIVDISNAVSNNAATSAPRTIKLTVDFTNTSVLADSPYAYSSQGTVASLATQGSVASVASQATSASLASQGTAGVSSASIASFASTASLPNTAQYASQGSVASRASRASYASSASHGTIASLVSTASFASRASEASRASVASMAAIASGAGINLPADSYKVTVIGY